MGEVPAGGVTRGDVRVRRAMADDALVVAALRLQAARVAGAPPEPGFLDRFAAAWDPVHYPTWVAEQDGSHAGVLITQVTTGLPWPGSATERRLHVVTLHTSAGSPRGVLTSERLTSEKLTSGGSASDGSAVAAALTTAMTTWARDAGLTPAGAP